MDTLLEGCHIASEKADNYFLLHELAPVDVLMHVLALVCTIYIYSWFSVCFFLIFRNTPHYRILKGGSKGRG